MWHIEIDGAPEILLEQLGKHLSVSRPYILNVAADR
jgi:hypothetical protein